MSEAAFGADIHPGESKELRLALVCYGGVSLAIYMHGQTKEVHRLVKASALLEAGLSGGGSPSERVYRELLARLAEEHPEGVRTRVVVDVVAGTSAGGINGVYLAKALAHNLSQDGLRDLWFDKGDIAKLLRGPSWLPLRLRAGWVLATPGKGAPLRGDSMSHWLFDALAAMDEGGSEPRSLATLMPERHLLQLFVTATDFYGYNRTVGTRDPRFVVDRRHRHVLTFDYSTRGVDELGRDHDGALAFAARTTSCFPGAFPPVSLERFEGYLRGRDARLAGLEHRFFRLYELSGASARETFFVDGGVLDNRPFGHAIRAVRERPASVEVDRRLLYLEPDPGRPGPLPAGREPGTLATVLGSVSGIPRKEPILDELIEVQRLNERVRRIRDIVETSFERIADRVEDVLGDPLAELPGDPESATFAKWSKRINVDAQDEAGFGYATYIRMKVSGVVDRYAATLCAAFDYPDDSTQAFFVRGVMRSWATGKELFERRIPPTAEQVAFLDAFDLGYRERRLRFVIAGVNWWYRQIGEPGYPARADLDAVKRRLYGSVDILADALRDVSHEPALYRRLEQLLGEERLAEELARPDVDPEAFARAHAAELDAIAEGVKDVLATRLRGVSARLFVDLNELTRPWEPPRRRGLLVRYLGFPFWDVLLYPFQSLADVGERDAVDVMRMSPDDATLLRPPGGGEKLKGVGMHHFGAFFDRAYRENDYLWGRLDAAERLLGVLLGTDHPAYAGWCRRAFEAILEEDEEALPRVGSLVVGLREQCAALTAASERVPATA
jgi:patatin-related protein